MKFRNFLLLIALICLSNCETLENAEKSKATETSSIKSESTSQNQDFVIPTIIPSSQRIGGQVPSGFETRPIATSQTLLGVGVGVGVPVASNACPCATQIPSACPVCTATPTPEIYRDVVSLTSCKCAPKLDCSPCPALYAAVHEMALRQVIFY